jgi:hypothetical protein
MNTKEVTAGSGNIPPLYGRYIAKIDTSQTPEKFQNMKDEVLSFLITNLLSLNDLETKYFEKYNELDADKKRLGIPSNQTHPKGDELWEEYHQRCKEILALICIKSFNETRSMGKPAEYDYLDYNDTKILFIMKSDSRAVVETYYEDGIKEKQQFVLKKTSNGWKIDKKSYGFQDEDTWHKDNGI